MATGTNLAEPNPGTLSPSSRVGGAERRDRDLHLRSGFLPERRRLVTVLVRDPKTGETRCSIFPKVELAERFIRATIRVSGNQGFLAYWTLGDEPDISEPAKGEAQAQVVVVSRSNDAPDLVTPHSFRDMDSARIYFERDRERELAAERASVFWGQALEIRRDASGSVKLIPPSALADQMPDQVTNMGAGVPLLSTLGDRSPEVAAGAGQIVSVRSVLTIKRWSGHAPREFHGFHSPPGRF